MTETADRLRQYMTELFGEEVRADPDSTSFAVQRGTAEVNVTAAEAGGRPVVTVFTWVARGVSPSEELNRRLLAKNAASPFGAYGMTEDGSVVFQHSIPGETLDKQQLRASIDAAAAAAAGFDEPTAEPARPRPAGAVASWRRGPLPIIAGVIALLAIAGAVFALTRGDDESDDAAKTSQRDDRPAAQEEKGTPTQGELRQRIARTVGPFRLTGMREFPELVEAGASEAYLLEYRGKGVTVQHTVAEFGSVAAAERQRRRRIEDLGSRFKVLDESPTNEKDPSKGTYTKLESPGGALRVIAWSNDGTYGYLSGGDPAREDVVDVFNDLPY
jgi:hypothetical protein